MAGKKSIIVGDFNVPDTDWQRSEATGNASQLLQAVEDSLMEHMVGFQTHPKSNTCTEVGKVNFKSNGDEALSDESPQNTDGDEALNVIFLKN